MKKKEKSGTLVGIGISMDFTENAMKDEDRRSGILRILVAGRAEWSIEWTVILQPGDDIRQLGSGDNVYQLCDKTKETEVHIAGEFSQFAKNNWDNEFSWHGSRDGKCAHLATWKTENTSVWYTTYGLEEETIKEIIELCERTCKSRTEPSTGQPD